MVWLRRQAGLLYKLNTFDFSSPWVMTRYLSCINPAHLEKITHIVVHLKAARKMLNPFTPGLLASLATLKGLRSLDVRVVVDEWCKRADNKGMYVVAEGVRERWRRAKWDILGWEGEIAVVVNVRMRVKATGRSGMVLMVTTGWKDWVDGEAGMEVERLLSGRGK